MKFTSHTCFSQKKQIAVKIFASYQTWQRSFLHFQVFHFFVFELHMCVCVCAIITSSGGKEQQSTSVPSALTVAASFLHLFGTLLLHRARPYTLAALAELALLCLYLCVFANFQELMSFHTVVMVSSIRMVAKFRHHLPHAVLSASATTTSFRFNQICLALLKRFFSSSIYQKIQFSCPKDLVETCKSTNLKSSSSSFSGLAPPPPLIFAGQS